MVWEASEEELVGLKKHGPPSAVFQRLMQLARHPVRGSGLPSLSPDVKLCICPSPGRKVKSPPVLISNGFYWERTS